MKRIGIIINILASILVIILNIELYGQSGRVYRRSSIMRGNLVKTVFGNWGVIGQPAEKGCRGAWIYDNNGYIGDVSPIVGAEVVTADGTRFHSVVVCPVNRPTQRHEQSPSGEYWGFEPVAGYFNENQESIALYSDPSSWPFQWPDKMNDPLDPGWSGSWNGFFGKTTTAAEEAFFVMDDNNDREFNFSEYNRWNVAFKPDSTDPSRNGLGLEVKVRAMQWSDFLAQDCIFWLYEITNTSTTDYSKVVFGMLVGTYIGVTSTEDYGEYDDDYSFFDVEKDLTYTADFDDNASRNPLWTGDVGVVGYAFLESPGNPYDGIDNDGDADDHPLIPATAPFFTADDFSPRILKTGDKIVLIDKNYERTVHTVPDSTIEVTTMGKTVTIVPGITEVAEGNVIFREGKEMINPNAYDGIDNDLDGLIDENYYLHYRQLRKDQQGNILIDKLSPVRHKDYINGIGLNDPLIDERRDDGIDNDGDWNAEYDDVGMDGIPNTGDTGEGDGVPTPGEPNFDQTDVDESDQIGLTSFEYFTPALDISLADDEDLWRRLAPGYFEVPASIVNNKPERGEDGDFTYGSGYFPLRAGETQRFSLALVYGEGGGKEVDIEDLLNNRKTVQKIYDSDYRFPPAPDKPTLVAVPGDGKVILYWDRKAEDSFDPVLKKYDFEGYKIYRATDHNFNEIFNITDASGNPIAYEPIAQFDKDNGIKGYFRPSSDLFQQSRGASFYLGNDSGLKHSFIDTDVENGRRYFYAVVAYDRGDETLDIFPKENDKRIDISPSGEVRTFQNTSVVIPNAEVAGYTPPPNSVRIPTFHTTGTGKVYYKIVDETAVKNHDYQVEFWDTSNDGIDNNDNWDILTDDVGMDGIPNTDDTGEGDGVPTPGEPNLDQNDKKEYFVPITTFYSVKDMTGITETFTGKDTVNITLSNKHIVEESVKVYDPDGETIEQNNYILDAASGKIRGSKSGVFQYGVDYKIFYNYYPVYRSPYLQNSPYAEETKDSDIFDGLWLSFNNHWNVKLDTSRTGWADSSKVYNFTFNIIDTYFGSDRLLGLRHPADYQIIFDNIVIDTSLTMPELYVQGIPVNFRVFNITENKNIDFIFVDLDRNQKLSPYDEIVFVEEGNNGEQIFTWDIFFTSLTDTVYMFGTGDTLTIRLKKPFQSGDILEFSPETPEVDVSLSSDSLLNMIKVVPNPYVVATSHELPLPPAITSGRGERKIDFIHLPPGATIHIFTSRGELVRRLSHNDNIHDGTVSWNLKTLENLDIATGIYFYVVESDIGQKTGKIAIIK